MTTMSITSRCSFNWGGIFSVLMYDSTRGLTRICDKHTIVSGHMFHLRENLNDLNCHMEKPYYIKAR